MTEIEKCPPEEEGQSRSADQVIPELDYTELSRDEAEILEQVGPEKARLLMRAVSHIGPIPPANVLRAYEPDVRAKIVDWADGEYRHRHQLEVQAAGRAENRMDVSQRNFFILGVLGLLLSAAVGIWGSQWVAGIIAVFSIGGPTAATALSRVFGRNERP